MWKKVKAEPNRASEGKVLQSPPGLRFRLQSPVVVSSRFTTIDSIPHLVYQMRLTFTNLSLSSGSFHAKKGRIPYVSRTLYRYINVALITMSPCSTVEMTACCISSRHPS